MDKRFPQEFLDIVLNSENGAIPGRADLPSLWRLIPPEKLSSRNPEYPARLELLGPTLTSPTPSRGPGKDCVDFCVNFWIIAKMYPRS